MNSSAKWCFSYPLTSQRSEGSKQLRRMQITQPRVSKGGNTFTERREYFCLSGGAVTMGHSRGHEMWLERWATREMLASDLCGSQYIWISVLSQGPRKEKRQIICSWRLNTNSAWGEPQFAQIVQFLKLCFFQYATILAAACLGTLHTPDLLTGQGYFILQFCVGCTTLCVLPVAFPSHLHGGYKARWLLTHQCHDISATPLTPWPGVSEQPTQTFYVKGYESITVPEGILIKEPFTDFL